MRAQGGPADREDPRFPLTFFVGLRQLMTLVQIKARGAVTHNPISVREAAAAAGEAPGRGGDPGQDSSHARPGAVG